MWLLLIAIVVAVVIGIKRKQERDEKERQEYDSANTTRKDELSEAEIEAILYGDCSKRGKRRKYNSSSSYNAPIATVSSASTTQRNNLHYDEYSVSSSNSRNLYDFPDDVVGAIEAFLRFAEIIRRRSEEKGLLGAWPICCSMGIEVGIEDSSGFGSIIAYFSFDSNTVDKTIAECGYKLCDKFSIEEERVWYRNNKLRNVRMEFPFSEQSWSKYGENRRKFLSVALDAFPIARPCSIMGGEKSFWVHYDFENQI